jgi:hypothetical protein
VPTFVPSIITGVTSTVTSFKSLPKNKNAMLDIAVAGPLSGMLASVAGIVLGSQLTLISDPSFLPALPLNILRQSTLGGGIINAILGNGALSLPVGAIGTEAVAGMTIPLHPIAIAGFIGLIVNALSMLPIGSKFFVCGGSSLACAQSSHELVFYCCTATDGGRVGLSLFGRATKLAIGQVTLVSLFFVGLLGSDLFLFYIAFVLAFQTGNDVPSINEVDKVDVPRVALAATSFILAVLVLVPFQ